MIFPWQWIELSVGAGEVFEVYEMKKIALIHPERDPNLEEMIQEFREHDLELIWIPELADSKDEELIISRLKGFSGSIAYGERYSRKVLEALSPELKIVARIGVGYDQVDVEAATERHIAVCTTPQANSMGVAELALALLLATARDMGHFDRQMHNGIWEPYTADTLVGRTIGTVGFGSIGKCVCKLLQPFGCQLLAYNRSHDMEAAEELGVEFVDMDTIARECDYITVNLPLTEATRGIIGKEFFDKMKPTAAIVNTSRGAVIDEAAMIEALQNGTIRAAGLDVFAQEPLPKDSPLVTMDNVVSVPHVAGKNNGSAALIMASCKQSVLGLFVEGKIPEKNLRNPGFDKT